MFKFKYNYFCSYNIFDMNELPVGSGWVVIKDIEKIKTSEDILELEKYIEDTQKLNRIVLINFIRL